MTDINNYTPISEAPRDGGMLVLARFDGTKLVWEGLGRWHPANKQRKQEGGWRRYFGPADRDHNPTHFRCRTE